MKIAVILAFALLFVNAASLVRYRPGEGYGRRGMDRRLGRQQPSAKDEFERLIMLCLQHPPPPPPPDSSTADDSSAPEEPAGPDTTPDPEGPNHKKGHIKKEMAEVLEGLVKCVMAGGPPQVQPPLPEAPAPDGGPTRALIRDLLRVSEPIVPPKLTPGMIVKDLVIMCLGELRANQKTPEEAIRAALLLMARQEPDGEDEFKQLVKGLVKCVQANGGFGKKKGESSSAGDSSANRGAAEREFFGSS